MTEKQTIIQLLGSVALIKKKYTEIAKITGENFNVFNILGLSTYEVRTHSAFLAELLNPSGSHGKGDAFLRKFAHELNIDLDYSSTSVFVERHVKEGNIDILITDRRKAVIIENKIYAKDQDRQLQRYFEYGSKVYGKGNFQLLYLTLNGNNASEESFGPLICHEDYQLISYKSDILNWLSACMKEASEFPLVRETIAQYINLIKKLTHQSMNAKMVEDIVEEILSSNRNIDSAFEIAASLSALKNKIIMRFAGQLESFANANNLRIKFRDRKEDFGTNESEVVFSKEGAKHNVTLAFTSLYESILIGESDENHKWIEGKEKKGTDIWGAASWAEVNAGVVTQKVGEIILSIFEKQ